MSSIIPNYFSFSNLRGRMYIMIDVTISKNFKIKIGQYLTNYP